MKKYCFRIIAMLLLIFISVPVMEAEAKEFYWYCKRNAEHRQPDLDSDFSFIEELGGVYVDTLYPDMDGDRVIYLTFDVGYENGNVEKVLDALETEGVRGSFFILGNVIDRAPELVKRMAEGGHSVCNHTVNHKNLVNKNEETVKEEIIGLEDKYRELTGREMSKFFRPPEGTFDRGLLEEAQKLGYRTVFWSFAYADWDNNNQMGKRAAMDIIERNLHNGEIMLLHPTGATNAAIMKDLIVKLKDMGYRFATLDELK